MSSYRSDSRNRAGFSKGALRTSARRKGCVDVQLLAPLRCKRLHFIIQTMKAPIGIGVTLYQPVILSQRRKICAQVEKPQGAARSLVDLVLSWLGEGLKMTCDENPSSSPSFPTSFSRNLSPSQSFPTFSIGNPSWVFWNGSPPQPAGMTTGVFSV